ncbi:MAG TPA: hypothetical protein PLO61_01005 [Fimbriimonadaceae bacterium]|nr:hypothetical protein [Fimbriimonadaceae bacterium]HRJ32478.1 hypothetical protein [Fimbriimonadaceae bacterium]
MQSFESKPGGPWDQVRDEELGELLERLHASDRSMAALEQDHSDTHAIRSLCEVTGRSEAEVLQVLQEVRRERREAELARRLLELEEPLFRVERPSTELPVDPFMNYDWKRRIPISRALMDREALERRRVRLREKLDSRSDEMIGRWALWIMAGLSLLLIAGAVVSSWVR